MLEMLLKNRIIYLKDVCAELEVTLSGEAYELVGELVSGKYILVNETNSKVGPCWKKDGDDLFIFRIMSSFRVRSGKIYEVNYL